MDQKSIAMFDTIEIHLKINPKRGYTDTLSIISLRVKSL